MIIPKVPEEFTADWLNEALASKLGDAKVQNVDAKPSNVPGQTAEIAFLDVTYSHPECELPTNIVAKYTSQNPQVITDIIANYDQYRRETSFYAEFPEVGIATPECVYGDYDRVSRSLFSCKLIPPNRPPAISDAQVRRLCMPGLRQWWQDPILREKDWIVQFDNRDFCRRVYGAAHMVAPIINDLYDDVDRLRGPWQWLKSRCDANGPLPDHSLLYGDYHATNVFPTDGGEFAVIDWRFCMSRKAQMSRASGLGQPMRAACANGGARCRILLSAR